jgi:ketosteroid isomerase-like protein
VHEEAVLAANEAFYRAFNQKDQDAMEALWARSIPVHCIHPGWNVLSGREPVIESWRRILSNEEQPKLLTGGASATVRGEMAVVICREFVAGTPLAATNVFVLEDGGWKLAHHHSGPVAVIGQ